jgi:hypothetical protein
MPSAIQSATSPLGIKLIASVFAALAFFLGGGCQLLCKIDTMITIQMARESVELRKEYAA